ncbi:MAG: hypothetical protein EB127_04500, partial [Alphaproteobacteria bacterium]|nr:hypothetical protein [Alphaproteobacteria bacterium]
MKAVMSFCPVTENLPLYTYNNFSFACALAKKHFGEVHLIGNNLGVEFLKNIPWSSTSNIMSDLDLSYQSIEGYTRIWALSYFSKMFESFIYVNSDCFLW